jgi:DNA repair photolyase
MAEAHKGITVAGRGASSNPPNRFENLAYEVDLEETDGAHSGPKTQYLRDTSKSIISYNDSPDIPFDSSVNPYRGCEHGCIYCYARPTHEFLGFSAGLDFETRILVKEDAPALLRNELSSRKWKPQVLVMSGVTDPYQPIESRLQITRGCLEVLAEFRNPVGIVTKNHLVTRDIDVLKRLAEFNAIAVSVSVTSLEAKLAHVMEPRTSPPERRLRAIEELAAAGIPTGVMVAPVIPGLTDHEIPSIISAAAGAGAMQAGYVVLRLPYAVAGLFETWLSAHFPDRKKKVLDHIRDLRDGRLNDPSFKSRMRGKGVYADQIRSMFTLACRKAGLSSSRPALSTEHFRLGAGQQPSLFE